MISFMATLGAWAPSVCVSLSLSSLRPVCLPDGHGTCVPRRIHAHHVVERRACVAWMAGRGLREGTVGTEGVARRMEALAEADARGLRADDDKHQRGKQRRRRPGAARAEHACAACERHVYMRDMLGGDVDRRRKTRSRPGQRSAPIEKVWSVQGYR